MAAKEAENIIDDGKDSIKVRCAASFILTMRRPLA